MNSDAVQMAKDREIDRLEKALRLIVGDGCQRYFGDFHCWGDKSRTPTAPYEADRWCESCIAEAALNPHLPEIDGQSGGKDA